MAAEMIVLVLEILAGVLFAVLALIAAYLHHQHRKYRHIPGPPLDCFVRGHVPLLMRHLGANKAYAVFLSEMISEYGHTIKLFFFHIPVVVTVHPESVKDLLVSGNHRKDPKTFSKLESIFGERWIGHGLVTDVNPHRWGKRRTFMNTAFYRPYLKGLMPQFNVTADKLMEKFSTMADGDTKVNMLKEFSRATLDAIGQVAFGMELDSLNDGRSPFPSAIALCLQGIMTKMANPFSSIDFQHRQYRKKVRTACRVLRQTGESCIEQRRRAIKNNENVPQDILAYIIKLSEENPDIDPEILVDDFVTFFLGGHESTAGLLAFAVIEIARNPDIYNRLEDEISEVLGDRPEVSFDDINKMPYLSKVLKETLRLYPLGDGTTREVRKDHLVGGYTIPAGTSVMVSSFSSGRLEEHYENPLKFDPSRFDESAEKKVNVYTYFPFSLGPRSCIGQTFAKIEAKVILAKLIQRFMFTLDPDQSFNIVQTLSLRPMGGAVCTLQYRK